MAEKIDIHRYEQRYRAALKRFRRCRNVIPQNRDLIVRFLDDCELGKTIKNAQKKRIGAARRLKYLNTLKRLSAWLNKPFERVAQQDMEKLIRRLDRNEYKGRAGKVFSEETKADYKKAVKKFYKWLQGDNEKYPELVNWIETFVKVKEIPALSRDQVEKMMERCSKPRDKALIAVLFDSGARAQEFLNIRLLHLTKKDDYYVVRIEHSKTKPRTISLPLCTKELEAWLAVHPDRDNPESQLFPMAYPALRMILWRAGKRALGRPVNPHLLRHSSVTYYCTKLNYFQLCYRYGWSMSSGQPARYIDRQGIHDQKTAEAVKTESVAELRKTNEELREDIARLKERLDKSESRSRMVDKLMNLLTERPDNVAALAKEMASSGLKEEFEERC